MSDVVPVMVQALRPVLIVVVQVLCTIQQPVGKRLVHLAMEGEAKDAPFVEDLVPKKNIINP